MKRTPMVVRFGNAGEAYIKLGPRDVWAVVDQEDVPKVQNFSWHLQQPAVGKRGSFYAVAYPSRRMHRVILGVEGQPELVDHVDGNGLDNRKSNLRLATNSQNGANTGKPHGTYTSRYKGVTYRKHSKAWVARITVAYKTIHLGYFALEEEAARACDRKAIEVFGQFARTNFPITN